MWLGRTRIYTGRALVQEDQPRVADQGDAQRELALHAARVSLGSGFWWRGSQAHLVHQIGNHLVELALRHRDALQAAVDLEVLDGRQLVKENVVLRTHTEAASDGRQFVLERVAHDVCGTRGRWEESGQNTDGSRLASAIVSEQRKDLAGLHLQIDAVDGNDVGLGTTEPALVVDFAKVRDGDTIRVDLLERIALAKIGRAHV